ncbi:MAG: RecQ family ATP-dependent DNA helicase, partial [Bacteroidales bacterium]
MKSIAFVDTEVDTRYGKLRDIGSIKSDGSRFHGASVAEFVRFVRGVDFICGHNILSHDLNYIGKGIAEAGIRGTHIMDTLPLSPLLFPRKPYHALLKDDKLQTEALNNPLNDAIKAKELFEDEVEEFGRTKQALKDILYLLLHRQKEFLAFFRFMEYTASRTNPEKAIRETFENDICEHAGLSRIISRHPVALAYCLALIHAGDRHSITPPWVIRNYPEVEQVMFQLRNKPCLRGCAYCHKALDTRIGLKRFFGFDSFKTFDGKPLQENAMKAAVDGKSILTVFPTGGGKSITFQVPALMSGETVKGLTVIISPLQSLMKDQVDNLEKLGITDAVTINGLLDPVERAKSFERVEDGSASILYISPESLRSPSIERRITGRKITRFVIDEAHCFSAWGQDFRVDYLYIGDFIKSVQEKKQLDEAIPVSCFTATAKQLVIQDICSYFREKLQLELQLFTAKTARKNLTYRVFEKEGEQEKYQAVRNLVEEKECPAIVYVSRTRKANQLAARLNEDGITARPYHGKMDVKEKSDNQNAFIDGKVPVIVATSAFGMGVDKKDVGMVIHYDISDSLENYVQEAGRAGRDENIMAECYVLYNEEDLSKHFVLLNQTRLSVNEIQQVWRAIKEITRFRSRISNSALEIARKAGWDDNVAEIETRVTTAIAALEEAGYLKRGQNMPGVFANSILTKNAQQAIDKISHAEIFNEKQKEQAIRIIKKLFSVKSRKQHDDEKAESRIDYISDHLGIPKEQVIRIVNLLRDIKILADTKDLTAFVIKGKQGKNQSLSVVKEFRKIEKILLNTFSEEEAVFHNKSLNEKLEEQGCSNITSGKVKTIINFWAIKNWIYSKRTAYSKDNLVVRRLHSRRKLEEIIDKKYDLAICIIGFFYNRLNRLTVPDDQDMEQSPGKDQVLVEFSVLELR